MLRRLLLFILFVALPALAATPDVGEHAPDFALSTPDGSSLSLNALTAKAATVLVVLRGYPGYQCPYCQRQAQDFISHASEFGKMDTQVLMVYPGPSAGLAGHGREFLDKRTLPGNVHLVIDPDYRFTNRYGLRWNAANETAYPSTFVIDRGGRIVFRKISHEHGDRTTAADVLAELRHSAAK